MSTTRKTEKLAQDQEARALAAAEANVTEYREGSAEITPEGGLVIQLPTPVDQGQVNLDQAQAEVIAHAEALALEDEGEKPSPDQVDQLAQEAGADSAKAADIRQAAGEVGIPTRATWKQHGQPVKGWTYWGDVTSGPEDKGLKVAKVELDKQGITIKGFGGKQLARFGVATKFWAIVPADAPRHQAEAQAPKTPKTPRPIAEGRVSAAEKLAAALSGDKAHQPAPAGYQLRWPHPSYDLLKADGSVADIPMWLVRCNLHNTTTPCDNTKDGDSKGTKAGRPAWCSACKKDQAKAAKAEAASK